MSTSLKTPVKISIIGAGSPTFTPAMFGDLCKTPRLEGSEVIFYDTNIERNNNMTNVCEKYAKQVGADIYIWKATEQRQAIEGVDFIINAALSSGWSNVKNIREQIYKKTGISAPIEAQAYFGQLNFLLSVAKKIKDINPNATLIQCANPMPEGGTLINRETGIKFIGVCHGYNKFDQIMGLLGMKKEEVEATIAGINHNLWLLRFKYRGEDAYPRLWKWMELVSEDYSKYIHNYLNGVDYQISPAAIDISRYFGLFPVGDTTRASQPHMWRWHRSKKIETQFYGPIGGRESVKGFQGKMEERNTIIKEIEKANYGNGQINNIFPTGFSEWQIVDIITSIISNTNSTQIVNIPNNGAISGLPDDLIVEIPAVIKGNSIVTREISFPDKVWKESIVPHWQQIERHVEAFRTKNIDLLLTQIEANPSVKNKRTAEKILNIWLENDKEMVKHFKKKIIDG